MAVDRYERRVPSMRPDQRNAGQRDRDRILYTSAFMRLAGVTQVVSPSEGFVCHNRMSHTVKVAQIARRLAEKLHGEQPEIADAIGGIDPEIADAAGLAHDLGHPPFGHVAEETLGELLEVHGNRDGYEGNAQSFRIVTKLAARGNTYRGLNLTRATLNAILKYPHLRADNADDPGYVKYGAYDGETAEFEWARLDLPVGVRSVEAELMDWADDIAYSVHDAEDFFRAGLIPMHLLNQDTHERKAFLDGAIQRRTTARNVTQFSTDRLCAAFIDTMLPFPLVEPYHGILDHRFAVRTFTSDLINKYVGAIRLVLPSKANNRYVEIVEQARMEVAMLKELTWYYVINRPSLATQQHAARKIIHDLFGIYLEAAHKEKQWTIFPHGTQEMLKNVEQHDDATHARIIADLISSMTETQAQSMHRRLTGTSLGSILDHT